MRLSICLAALAATAALAACVPVDTRPHPILTDRGNRVQPTGNPGEFEVLTRPGDAGAQLWCAAGEYAESQTDARPSDRIYLVHPRGPSASHPGRKSAIFTVRPDAELLAQARALPDQIVLGVSRVGSNWARIHAQQVCRPLFNLPD
ncbi:hypothetical protein JMM63_07315 [Rhodovulum sulfidophilum]|uniref:hypothetical protein n=1 Tax=Rhodovulum sulfidophilum TaxID=35806 RepID=UPI0009521264|nr:hypothetical protein [Rhodovulum sulfidophilum]MBL3550920.1 hypothetical protein [Rhodovulum sulfidophilum]MBL3585084.1 hypothetical protein [Rhodovulum sulfidophilum]MBL3595379.1 hypothetical protein [Rhodovulum sulfidophilum]OLS49456.1 hypothetical protein BV379_15005 [Rhodovulum sulfidophilum]